MSKIGRNDPCPCGSGKKYKKCHINQEIQMNKPTYYHPVSGMTFSKAGNALSLYDRNMTFLDGVADILPFDSKKGWNDMKQKISREHVREIYKLIAYLWPPETNIETLFPKPENNLRSLYLGYMRPESILDSVVRYSLYCDQILVVDPFMNPWCVQEEYNPLVHPEGYLSDTLKWLLLIFQLAPWIENKNVILIPDPGNFDYQLRIRTLQLAEERAKGFALENFKDPQLERYSKQDFKRMWLSMPTDVMIAKLKKEKMTEQEIASMLAYVQRLKDSDPYFPTNPKENGMSGYHISTTGANLEMGLFISQMTGSYMYTDFNSRWEEISSVANLNEQQEMWGPLTHAFQELDFQFLNKVDPIFASRLRQDGRLENMRNFLRKVWQSTCSEDPMNKETILGLKDELTEECHKAETEWKKIDVDLAKWILSEGGAGSLLSAGMNWQIPALGFSMVAIGQLLSSRYKRERFRSNVPLSVFVDLKNKR